MALRGRWGRRAALRREKVDDVHDGNGLSLIGSEFRATFPTCPQGAFRCREHLPVLGHFQAAFGRLTDDIVVHRHRGRGGARLKDDIAHADFGVAGNVRVDLLQHLARPQACLRRNRCDLTPRSTRGPPRGPTAIHLCEAGLPSRVVVA